MLLSAQVGSRRYSEVPHPSLADGAPGAPPPSLRREQGQATLKAEDRVSFQARVHTSQPVIILWPEVLKKGKQLSLLSRKRSWNSHTHSPCLNINVRKAFFPHLHSVLGADLGTTSCYILLKHYLIPLWYATIAIKQFLYLLQHSFNNELFFYQFF